MRHVPSYHNDPAVKAYYVDSAKQDILDNLFQCEDDSYPALEIPYSLSRMSDVITPPPPFNEDKDDDYSIVAKHAGLPEWLVNLIDTMFVYLPAGERERFHVDVREAIPVGVSIDRVRFHLALTRLDRLITLQTANHDSCGPIVQPFVIETLNALTQVRRCIVTVLGRKKVDWVAARATAHSAARTMINHDISDDLTDIEQSVFWSQNMAAHAADEAAYLAAEVVWLKEGERSDGSCPAESVRTSACAAARAFGLAQCKAGFSKLDRNPAYNAAILASWRYEQDTLLALLRAA